MSVYSIHQFAEKVALVTDIDGPVGRAVSMQLALQGGFIIGGVPGGKESSAGSGLADDLRELGTLASSVNYERSSNAGADALARTVRETFGRLDLLINCVRSEPESAFLIQDAVQELMADRPSPRIVDVFELGSGYENVSGRIGHLREDTARRQKLLPHKYRSNGVAIVGEVFKPAEDDALFRAKGTIEPDDVARVILFLLSSEAKAVRGQLIVIGHPPA